MLDFKGEENKRKNLKTENKKKGKKYRAQINAYVAIVYMTNFQSSLVTTYNI